MAKAVRTNPWVGSFSGSWSLKRCKAWCKPGSQCPPLKNFCVPEQSHHQTCVSLKQTNLWSPKSPRTTVLNPSHGFQILQPLSPSRRCALAALAEELKGVRYMFHELLPAGNQGNTTVGYSPGPSGGTGSWQAVALRLGHNWEQNPELCRGNFTANNVQKPN